MGGGKMVIRRFFYFPSYRVYKFSCGLTEVSLVVVNAFSEYLCSEFYVCHLNFFWKYCG